MTRIFLRGKLFQNQKGKNHGAALDNLLTTNINISINIGVTSFKVATTKDIAPRYCKSRWHT